jgi:hypothetical protein
MWPSISIFLKMRSQALNFEHLRYFAEVARRGSVTGRPNPLVAELEPPQK